MQFFDGHTLTISPVPSTGLVLRRVCHTHLALLASLGLAFGNPALADDFLCAYRTLPGKQVVYEDARLPGPCVDATSDLSIP